MKSRLIVFLFIIVSIYIFCNKSTYKDNIFRWDVTGYYMYLPAVFVYHDLGNLRFYPEINKKYSCTGDNDAYGIYDQVKTGRRTNKYAIGTAIFELPFFLIAHAYSLVSKEYEADGYTYPYQFAVFFSFVFWVAMGLFFIRGFLKKRFGDEITAFTLICIAFGTNIYCYTAFTPGMSHPFGFFLFAGILYCTDVLYQSKQSRHFYWLGILLGLVLITRPVNIAVAIIPLFWEVYNKQTLIERFKFLGGRIRDVSFAFIMLLLVSLIQMAYWKYTTGNWIHYSYEEEGFDFLRPHMYMGLFSYQKGWFLYTPIAFIAILSLLYMWFRDKKNVPVLFTFFTLMVYIVFSWRQWWYGGGFSARALIETLPALAFPLAVLAQGVFSGKRGLLKKISFSVVMLFFVVLNLFQTYQYSYSTIHYVKMTGKYYWRVFGKVKASGEDLQYLMTDKEYIDEVNEYLIRK